jgi:mitogen-activated protein kinase 1/3
MPYRQKRPFSQLYPTASSDAISLLELTLKFDPKKRLTAEQCLAHPYLANYREGDRPVDLRSSELTKRFSVV